MPVRSPIRCIAPANPCAVSDPCGHLLNARNTCTYLGSGKYACSCNQKGWRSSPELDACLHPDNPCDASDQCGSNDNKLNTCVDNQDGTYDCLCQGAGWSEGAGAQSCVAPLQMCDIGRPGYIACQIGNSQPLLRCLEDGAGKYHCECEQRGYQASGDYQRCEQLPNACGPGGLGDPGGEDVCQSGGNSKNTCVAGQFGTYTCKCLESGWKVSRGAQRCLSPMNMCIEGNDVCSTKLDRGNQCRDGGDGTYSCKCSGRGWSTSFDELSCIPPKNLCISDADPCGMKEHFLNQCIDDHDGTYRCQCGGEGWLLSPDQKSCACPNPCFVGDPCAMRENSENHCQIDSSVSQKDRNGNKLGPNKCGVHKCECAKGFRRVLTPWGSQRCQPFNPCIGSKALLPLSPVSAVGYLLGHSHLTMLQVLYLFDW